MRPNAIGYKPNATRLRHLIARAGVTQARAADLLGVDHRTMRRYLDVRGTFPAPYCVAFALHCLALARESEAKKLRAIAQKGLTA